MISMVVDLAPDLCEGFRSVMIYEYLNNISAYSELVVCPYIPVGLFDNT